MPADAAAAAGHTAHRMTVEIERRFLPDGALPVELGPGERIRQGYLAGEESVSVRLRITDDATTLTVKAGEGMVRTEVDIPLEPELAEALWPHTAGRRIDKYRHRVTVDSGGRPHVAEIDRYLDSLDGLVTIEVEFTDEHLARSFTPPTWFGREVTGRSEWSNAALARHGRPPTEQHDDG